MGGKYASALYVAAAKADTIESVEVELKEVEELAETNDDFANFLKDPSVPKKTRVAAIEDIFGKAGFSDLTKNFLCEPHEGDVYRNVLIQRSSVSVIGPQLVSRNRNRE